MSFSEELKSIRGKGYVPSMSRGYGEKRDSGMDSGVENSTSRIIKLSDEEQKSFQEAKSGEDLSCEVHGTLEEDGHFHVMSVSPMNGGASSEDEMANQVAQKVTPTIMPSPSA